MVLGKQSNSPRDWSGEQLALFLRRGQTENHIESLSTPSTSHGKNCGVWALRGDIGVGLSLVYVALTELDAW